MKNFLKKQKVIDALIESKNYNEDIEDFVLSLSEKNLNKILKEDVDPNAVEAQAQADRLGHRSNIVLYASAALMTILSSIAAFKLGKNVLQNKAQITLLKKVAAAFGDRKLALTIGGLAAGTATVGIGGILYRIIESYLWFLGNKCKKQYRLPADRNRCLAQAYEICLTKVKQAYSQCGTKTFPNICRARLEKYIARLERTKRKHLNKSNG